MVEQGAGLWWSGAPALVEQAATLTSRAPGTVLRFRPPLRTLGLEVKETVTMATNMRLANKGRGEPIGALVQQGNVSVGLAKLHATELGENGWPAGNTDALEAGVTELESTASVKADAEGSALDATKTEHKAIVEAKAFIRRLRNALPTVLRDSAIPGVNEKSFHAGTKLGRSAPTISKYLNEIRGAVVQLDEPLKAHFKGALASAALDKAKNDLDAADTTQEMAIAGLPGETLKVYELKGKVLEMIEDLNRAAKNAFDGQAELIGKFNKDILLRAKGGKAGKKVEEEKAPVAPVEGAPT